MVDRVSDNPYEGISLIPYIEIDGIRSFNDTFIKGLYARMVSDNLASKIFIDGSVRDETDFLNMYKYGGNNLFVIMENKEPVGITWLNGCRKNTAAAHFCLFKSVWGKGSVDIGKYVINKLLNLRDINGDYYHDVITGVIPEPRTFAIAWIQKIGMKIIGTIPKYFWCEKDNKSVDAVVAYIER